MSETRQCAACGSDVTRAPSRFTGERAFCDMECMSAGYDERPVVECEKCGDSFKRTQNQVDKYDTHYCSNDCMYAHHRGKDAPNWRGGRTEKFSATAEGVEWRESVFSRDDYTCQHCERTNCRLNAHHIEGRAEHPERATDVDNGVTLCLYCHARVHFEAGEMGAYRLIKGNLHRLSNV